MHGSKVLLLVIFSLLSVLAIGLPPDLPDKSLPQSRRSDSLPLVQVVTPTQTLDSDPALRNPMFANLARQHGSIWEKNLHPSLVLWVEWQRKLGTHALITGIGGVDPNGMPHARISEIMIAVTDWDGTDLFSIGLPAEYMGKPIKIVQMGFAHSLSYTPLASSQDSR